MAPDTKWYDSSSDSNFPYANYFLKTYKKTPHYFYTQYNKIFVDKSFYKWLLDNYETKLLWSSTIMKNKKVFTTSIVLDVPKLESIIELIVKDSEAGYDDDEYEFSYYKSYGAENNIGEEDMSVNIYFADIDILAPVIKKMQKSICKQPKENKISLVIETKSGLETKKFKIKIDDIDIGLNYGKDFVPVYDNIIKRLNSKGDKGLVLFHGIPGTGKTSLIKYIAKNIKKEVLFIPPHMTETISTPGFIPFLNEHSNSVLIIEDAERVIQDRGDNNFSAGVSNILNISDGILGDCLNIQIIATFNTRKEKVDPALLRKGRLIAEHEFKKLNVEDANILLKHIGKKETTQQPMTLTEIYNVDQEEFKTAKEDETIGFKRKY